MPAVSVIIPCYGRVPWTIEAVESVLTQTCADFEVIVIDDGSAGPIDLPARITSDRRVLCVRQRHQGAGAARNHGLSLAKGKYVAFLDSDDLFLPHKLEEQLSFMETRPHAVFSHTSYLTVDGEGRYIRTVESGRFGGWVYPSLIIQCPIATPTVMIRRDVLEELKFDKAVYPGEDIRLWIELGRRYQLLGLNEPLTKVRLHGRNAALDLQKQLVHRIAIIYHSVQSDPSLGVSFRETSIARVYWDAGKSYFKRFKLMTGMGCLIRASAAFVAGRCSSAVTMTCTALKGLVGHGSDLFKQNKIKQHSKR